MGISELYASGACVGQEVKGSAVYLSLDLACCGGFAHSFDAAAKIWTSLGYPPQEDLGDSRREGQSGLVWS